MGGDIKGVKENFRFCVNFSKFSISVRFGGCSKLQNLQPTPKSTPLRIFKFYFKMRIFARTPKINITKNRFIFNAFYLESH